MDLTRRRLLEGVLGAGAASVLGCETGAPGGGRPRRAPASPGVPAVLATTALGMRWPVRDPFVFCVHHDDRYPAGNDRLGPAASLDGRRIGNDFEGLDGWRMYHGDVVPGFPRHPHRGFETVTVVRRGLLDHSDSMGGAARYGGGDVQWLTAGRGIQHSEMFPLLDPGGPNPVELFQIWLNLPARKKMADPHFEMLWSRTIPRVRATDDEGRVTEVAVVAGRLADARAPAPPPDSYASIEGSDVAIWTLAMAPGARFTLPAAPGTHRSLYFFAGDTLRVGDRTVSARHEIQLRPDVDAALHNGDRTSEALLLQGRPIDEPIVQHGPWVMNSRDEIRQAIADYRRTAFGGWPWRADDPVHPRPEGRFARYPDGRVLRPT